MSKITEKIKNLGFDGVIMGEEYVVLTNPNNVQSGINRFPYSLPYGNSSVLSNPNVATAYGDGFYIYEKKTWINGGK